MKTSTGCVVVSVILTVTVTCAAVLASVALIMYLLLLNPSTSRDTGNWL